MSQKKGAIAEGGTVTLRSGVSRKTLKAKALKEAQSALPVATLEDSFPVSLPPAAEPPKPLPASDAAAAAPQPTATGTWSEEDEATLKVLMARRKAAGFQRRGRDLSSQILQPGQIKPNADTVAATIVGLIGSRESVARSELLSLMASATFPHPKAQPQDKGWCQGYVAGLIRNGFLVVVEEKPAAAAPAA